MQYYVMYGYDSRDYALPDAELGQFLEACEDGFPQLIDPSPLDIGLEEDSGLECPDLLVYGPALRLVSAQLRSALLDFRQSQVFFKPINLVCPEFGISEPYWLMLPPRIDCLDWEKCIIKENSDPLTPFWARYHDVQKIVIDGDMAGRYHIFKLPPNTLNQEVIVSEKLKDELEKHNFSNLYFDPLGLENQ